MILEFEDVEGKNFRISSYDIRHTKFHKNGNVTIYVNDTNIEEGILHLKSMNLYVKSIESWYKDGGYKEVTNEK